MQNLILGIMWNDVIQHHFILSVVFRRLFSLRSIHISLFMAICPASPLARVSVTVGFYCCLCLWRCIRICFCPWPMRLPVPLPRQPLLPTSLWLSERVCTSLTVYPLYSTSCLPRFFAPRPPPTPPPPPIFLPCFQRALVCAVVGRSLRHERVL